MSFCWCTIQVKDMKESLEFYQEIVGLEVDRNIKGEGGFEINFLGQGETKVESLDQKIEFVKQNNISIHSGPFEPNPYTRFFYVTDPNGLKIQFVENK